MANEQENLKTQEPQVDQEEVKKLEATMKQAAASNSQTGFATLADSMLMRTEEIAALANGSPAVKDKSYIADHYGNSLSAVGNEDRVQSFTNYGFSADTLNWPLWLALYNDSWVFRRAIDKPSRDEINCGFTLHGNADYTPIYRIFNRYKNDLIELIQWGALFGGSIAVMLFEGIKVEELKRPIVKSKIKGKRFKLYVVDRWYGVSPSVTNLVQNMKDIDYGKPMYYDVTMADGVTRKIHHSWVLRYEHRTAPKLIKNGQLQGWGYSEGSHIINELARDDQLKTSITSLVNKSLIEVVKMAGMRGVFMGTDKGNETQLRKRLEMVNWGRTYNSLTFLDKDDEYEHFELTGLTGLADLMEKNMWLISAALEMQGVLFGDLKGGLSQESDAYARYSKTILGRCDALVRPVLHKFLKILFIIHDLEESPDFDFIPLDKDEVNKKKVDSMKGLSDLCSKLADDGVISKYQYAKTMRNYMNEEVINLDFSDELLNKLKLEEEQAILDTIKEIGTKRHAKLNYNSNGSINQSNPFSYESEPEKVEENNPAPAVQMQQEAKEEAAVEETNEGENNNGESTGEQGS